jgi:sialic acid synthase SpsE
MGVQDAAQVTVGGRRIGAGSPTYCIAEIGSNHAGSLERARTMIVRCAAAGADAVKFQSWTSRKLQNCRDADGRGGFVDSAVLPVLERFELPEAWHGELAALCAGEGVDFLSTPFDTDRARLLRSLGSPAIKISSSDVVYDELLEEVAGYGVPVLLSVGMASLGEIERALGILREGGGAEVALLHCVADYPPVEGQANLRAIGTLRSAFGVPVGFSDHYPGQEAALAAVALGACIIEKHVVLARSGETPDGPFSLEIEEFGALVRAVRRLEAMLGDGVKRCMPCEAGGIVNGRRSLYAARDLVRGQVLTRGDIAVVRPNLGEMQPRHLRSVVGRRLAADVPCGAPLRWKDCEG